MSKTNYIYYDTYIDCGNRVIVWAEFIKYYIEENHSAKETAKHFKIPIGQITRFMNHYDVKKPAALCHEINKRTCLERYGDATYNNQAQLKQTNLKKYGCENVFQAEEIKVKLAQTKLQRYGDSTFVNPEKTKQTCLTKYGAISVSGLPEIIEKKKQTCLAHFGVEFPMQSAEVRAKYDFVANTEKAFQTKKQHGTTNTSKIQDTLLSVLREIYGEDDVLSEYKESRYPYHCDCYIKSKDLFIELNLYFTHGGRPFTGTAEDQAILQLWQEKAKTSKFFANAIKVWTSTDPAKQQCAKRNHLNYRMFYTEAEVYQFIEELKKT